MGRIYSANLTRGKGGIGSSYTDADYVRAIRHGVGRNGRPLLTMPTDALYYGRRPESAIGRKRISARRCETGFVPTAGC